MTIALGGVCVSLLAWCGWLTLSCGQLKVRIAFATDQTAIFNQMRTQARQSNVAHAAECLEYVVGYYPSGTKQEAGSRLDRIVEQARAEAVRDIIAQLRTRTGEKLGDQPGPWIEKYARPTSASPNPRPDDR